MKTVISILSVVMVVAIIFIANMATTIDQRNGEIEALKEVEADLIKVSTIALTREKEENLPLEKKITDWRGTPEYKGIFGGVHRVPVLEDSSFRGLENTVLEIYMYNNSQFKRNLDLEEELRSTKIIEK